MLSISRFHADLPADISLCHLPLFFLSMSCFRREMHFYAIAAFIHTPALFLRLAACYVSIAAFQLVAYFATIRAPRHVTTMISAARC